eukprot:1195395-Prorocentrum_minimum.AAC.1
MFNKHVFNKPFTWLVTHCALLVLSTHSGSSVEQAGEYLGTCRPCKPCYNNYPVAGLRDVVRSLAVTGTGGPEECQKSEPCEQRRRFPISSLAGGVPRLGVDASFHLTPVTRMHLLGDADAAAHEEGCEAVHRLLPLPQLRRPSRGGRPPLRGARICHQGGPGGAGEGRRTQGCERYPRGGGGAVAAGPPPALRRHRASGGAGAAPPILKNLNRLSNRPKPPRE